MTRSLKTIIIEDSEDDLILLLRALQRGGYDVIHHCVNSAETLRNALNNTDWDLIISEYSLSNFSAPMALQLLRECELDLPFIIISNSVGEELAVQALKFGANDYLLKSNLTRLVPAVERELRDHEQRRVRKTTEAQVERLSKALEQSSSLVLITDHNGIVLYCNQAFLRTTGFQAEQVIGVHSHVLRHAGPTGEETPQRLFDMDHWPTVLAGLTWRGELLSTRPDGEPLWLLVTMSPLRDQTGNITEVLIVLDDISEQKRLEAELRQHAEQLEAKVEERTRQLRQTKEQIEAILNNISDGIVLAQPQGDIRTSNPAFRSLFGNRVTGSVENILHTIPDYNSMEVVADALVSALIERKNRRVEARVLSDNGREIDVEFAMVALPNDEKQNVLLSAHDITHLKELERLKAQFIDNAVHDLSSPITAMATRLYLLKKSPEQIGEHMMILERQMEHLRNLVADLRGLSEIDRGQMLLDLEEVNLNDVAEEIIKAYHVLSQEKEQVMAFTPHPNLPSARLDRRKCERVVVNLISNAINYTPKAGAISVSTWYERDYVMLTVQDQGIGIAREELPHIFERFYRTERAKQTHQTGTGLGLAIVKELVEAHNGLISVESAIDEGSRFAVRLPRTLKETLTR